MNSCFNFKKNQKKKNELILNKSLFIAIDFEMLKSEKKIKKKKKRERERERKEKEYKLRGLHNYLKLIAKYRSHTKKTKVLNQLFYYNSVLY